MFVTVVMVMTSFTVPVMATEGEAESGTYVEGYDAFDGNNEATQDVITEDVIAEDVSYNYLGRGDADTVTDYLYELAYTSISPVSSGFGLNAFNNGNSENESLRNGGNIRIWTQIDGANSWITYANLDVTATLPNGDDAMNFVRVNRIWNNLGYVNLIDVSKREANEGPIEDWHWINLTVIYDGQEVELRLFNNYRVFGYRLFNNGPGGHPFTPNESLAAGGIIRMWTHIDGVPALLPYSSLTVTAVDQDGNDAMQFIRVNRTPWQTQNYIDLVDANKNAPWQWMDLTVTHMDQSHTLRLVNSRFFSVDIFNNGPEGDPSTPNESLADWGRVRIWTQLMGQNAPVPYSFANSMVATIRGSGECALDLITVNQHWDEINGVWSGYFENIDVEKTNQWEFIDFEITVFGQTIELVLHNGNYVPNGYRITFNFPDMQNMIVQYWSGGSWHTLAGGPFNDYAEFEALGATVVRAVRDGLVYSRNITADGDYVIDAPVIRLYVRGVPVAGNTLGVVGGGFGSNWVYNGVTAEVDPEETVFLVFDNRTYNVVLTRTGFFPLSRTATRVDVYGEVHMYVDLSAYLVYITVPAGVSNVRMQSNGWIVNPAQEGDVIWLVVDRSNYRDATVTFDYCCKVQHREDFILDGRNPLYITCCDDYFTVTFIRQNGAVGVFATPGAITTVQIASGTAITASDIPNYDRRTGFYFAGWYFGEYPSWIPVDDEYTYPLDYIVTGDVTFTARFNLLWHPVTFTIGEGGAAGSRIQNVRDGTPIRDVYIEPPNALALQEPLSGWRFVRWEQVLPVAISPINPVGIYPVGIYPTYPFGPMEFRAIFEPDARIISVIPNPAIVYQGDSVTITVTTQYMPDGAWIDLNLWLAGLSFEGGPRFYIVDNQVTITINADADTALGPEGFAVAARIEDPWGAPVIICSYDFVIDVIAPLEENTVTIIFDAGGGAGTMENVVWPAGEEYTLPANGFTAPYGFEFYGWFIEGYADPLGTRFPEYVIIVGLVQWQNTTVTLTALWVPIERTVTFNLHGGTAGAVGNTDPQTVNHGNTATRPDPNPTRTGFNFVNWFLTETGGTPFDFNTPITENIELHARWTPVGGGTTGGGGGGPATTIIEDPAVPLAQLPFSPYHDAFLIGTPEGNVRPQANMTRAEATTIFFRLISDDFRSAMWSQSNSFSDVAINHWFNNAVSTMSNAEVVRGRPDGTFAPNNTITRAEFVAMVARFLGEEHREQTVTFYDIDGHWAYDYINRLAGLGWVQGTGNGSFNPNAPVTRAEAAAIINRMLNRVLESTDGLLEGRHRWPDAANMNAWYYLYIQEATHSTEFERFAGGAHLRWTEILPNLDWSVLERPNSRPDDITIERVLQRGAATDAEAYDEYEYEDEYDDEADDEYENDEADDEEDDE